MFSKVRAEDGLLPRHRHTLNNNVVSPPGMKLRRFFKIVGLSLTTVAAAAVLLCVEGLHFVRSDNLKIAVERLVPRFMYARLSLGDVRVDPWSRFPSVSVQADSVAIVPYSPAIPDTLMTADSVYAVIDLRKISTRSIAVDTLRLTRFGLTLRQRRDSASNWAVLHRAPQLSKLPDISVGLLSVGAGSRLTYRSALARAALLIDIDTLALQSARGNCAYSLNLRSHLGADIAGWRLPGLIPVEAEGPVRLATHPITVALDSTRIRIAGVPLTASLAMDMEGGRPSISAMSIDAAPFLPGGLLRLLPAGLLSLPSGLDIARLTAAGGIRTLGPYTAGSAEYPPISAYIDIPASAIAYGGCKADVELQADATLRPGGSHDIYIRSLRVRSHGTDIAARGSLQGDRVRLGISGSTDIGRLAALLGAKGTPISGVAQVNALTAFSTSDIAGTLRASLGVKAERVCVRLGRTQSVKAAGVSASLSTDMSEAKALVRVRSADYSGNPSIRAALRSLTAQASIAPEGGIAAILNAGGTARQVVRSLGLAGSASASGGSMYTPSYPTPVRLDTLLASWSSDSLKVTTLRGGTAGSDISVKGNVCGLLAGWSARKPLRVSANVASHCLDVNEFAAAFRRGTGRRNLVAANVRSNAAADMRPVILPDYLDIRGRIEIDSMPVAGLPITRFGGRFRMADSQVSIPELAALLPFADARARVLFDTADSLDINLALSLDIDDFSPPGLAATFTVLDTIAPELRLIGGHINTSVRGSLSTFPDMVIDQPTVRADVEVEGRGLSIRQTRRVREITRLLRFPSGHPIGLDDFDLRAAVMSDRIMVYPTLLTAGHYSVSVMGEADFHSGLDLHADIVKSLLPFRFGVNYYGSGGKYKIRFGSTRYESKRALGFADIMPAGRVNMITELKYYLALLLDASAHTYNSAH